LVSAAAAIESSPKRPPFAADAERAVLGGVLLDNSAWDRIGDRLSEADFYLLEHRLIFRAARELIESARPADALTVLQWLEHQGLAEEVGGLPRLADLVANTPSAINAHAYSEIVHEKALQRALIEVGNTIAHSGFEPAGRPGSILVEEAERQVFALAERGSRLREGFTDIKSLLGKAVLRIEQLKNSSSAITGLPSGFDDLDDMTSGLQPGDLVIVAGRPAMGKTSFAMNIAEYAATREKKAVGVFSMEMPSEQLTLRMLASLGRVDQRKVRTGQLSEHEWHSIISSVSILSNANLHIDETPALSPSDLRARARRLKRAQGLDLIVVDYLQLMQVPGTGENRATEISEISRGLKALAKELHVPVIALSQLNRALEQRKDRRPMMSDLRESGAIEQDADLILFIYRDEVYEPESPDKGTAEIIIGKQRNGPIGTVRLTFLGEYTRFENLASPVYSVDTYSG